MNSKTKLFPILLWLSAAVVIFALGFFGKALIVDAVSGDTPVDLDGALTNGAGSLDDIVNEQYDMLYPITIGDGLYTDDLDNPVNIWLDHKQDGFFAVDLPSRTEVEEGDDDVDLKVKTMSGIKATILLSNSTWDIVDGVEEDMYISSTNNVVDEGDTRLTDVTFETSGMAYEAGTISDVITGFVPGTTTKKAHDLEQGNVVRFVTDQIVNEEYFVVTEVVDEYSFRFMGITDKSLGGVSEIEEVNQRDNDASNALTATPGSITAGEESELQMQSTTDMFVGKVVEIEGCDSEGSYLISEVQNTMIKVYGSHDCEAKPLGAVTRINFDNERDLFSEFGVEGGIEYPMGSEVELGDADYGTTIQPLSNVKTSGEDSFWDEGEQIYIDSVSTFNNSIDPGDYRFIGGGGDVVILGEVEYGTEGESLHKLDNWTKTEEEYALGVGIWIDTNETLRLNIPASIETEEEPEDESDSDDELDGLSSEERELIERAIELEVLRGDGTTGELNLDGEITRAELATLVDRAVDFNHEGPAPENFTAMFDDADVFFIDDGSSWFFEAAQNLVIASIMTGREEGGQVLFAPGGTVSRAEGFKVAALSGEQVDLTCSQDSGYPPIDDFERTAWWSDYATCLYDNEILGDDDLEPARNITRGEFIVMLMLATEANVTDTE